MPPGGDKGGVGEAGGAGRGPDGLPERRREAPVTHLGQVVVQGLPPAGRETGKWTGRPLRASLSF